MPRAARGRKEARQKEQQSASSSPKKHQHTTKARQSRNNVQARDTTLELKQRGVSKIEDGRRVKARLAAARGRQARTPYFESKQRYAGQVV